MQQLLALLVLVALATARPACCTPPQWEGEITGWDAKRNTSFFETISYDFHNQRLRVDAFTHHNREWHMFTVFEEVSRQDGKNRVYLIENDKCTVKEAEHMREACVRENHHEERKLVIGGMLHAKWYGFSTDKRQDNMIVSEHECIPVEGSFLEHHKRHYTFDGAVQFWNIRHGIGNPIIFEIPHICRK